MTLTQALSNSAAAPVILATIEVGVWCRAWVIDGALTNTYKVAFEHNVTAVRWNQSTLLTVRTSAALVDANQSSYYWDGTYLWVRPPTAQDIFEATVQAVVTFFFATQAKVLDSVFYDPRILNAPSLSRRIEAVFGGIGQVGGGSLSLANADGFFNEMQEWRWDAGTVTMTLGCDVHGVTMDFADYEDLAQWIVTSWERSGNEFVIRLEERKAKLESKLPNTFFNRDDFPNIDDDQVGKAIPLAYGVLVGVKPVLVDPGTRTFKVAGHAIKSFDGVRIQQQREEIIDQTITGSQWLLYSPNVYRFFVNGVTVKNLTADTVSLEEQNSIEDVQSTPGSWTFEDTFLYFQPDVNETPNSMVYAAAMSRQLTAWNTTDFASTDAPNGEFTLGTDWTTGTEVSVDFSGRLIGLELMTNAVDVVQDIMAQVGETNINSASFLAAREKLLIGITEYGDEVNVLAPSIYISDETSASDSIGRVLELAMGFLYINELGEYFVDIFEPEPGEGLPLFTNLELTNFEEVSTTDELFSQVQANYLLNAAEEQSQHRETETIENQYLANRTTPEVLSEDLEFSDRHDVIYWSERTLLLRGRPLRVFTVTMPWVAIQRQPGDQILLQAPIRDIEEVLEILSVKIDVGTKKVTLQLGKLRAFGDSPGFWVDDAAVLPTRFAQLAGYGAGSLDWNASWDSAIKTWARQNVGFWVDANGFASTSDPDSFMLSTWI